MACDKGNVDFFNVEINRFTEQINALTIDITNYDNMIKNAGDSSLSLSSALTHLDSASNDCVNCLSDGGNPVDKGFLSKKIGEINDTKSKLDDVIIPTLNSDRTTAVNQKTAAEENLARCIIQRDQAQASYEACVAAETAAAAAEDRGSSGGGYWRNR